MGRHTQLFDCHKTLGARMVDFGGWDMPVNYGSQIDEHHAVRRDAGMFDVSHMTVVDLSGTQTHAFLDRLLANDIGKAATPGKALYSCMLNDSGCVIDDLIVYYRGPHRYRMVVNAATREKDLDWIRRQAAAFDVDVDEREELAMIAVQGPNAREKAATVLPESDRDDALALKPFVSGEFGSLFVARTGYTGEDGWEIIVPGDEAAELWNSLLQQDIAPAGLGARDTLRLEAGMNLYGADMDETTTPLESGLAWTVSLTNGDGAARDFIGASALREQKENGVPRKFIGLLLEDRGVLRSHQRVVTQSGDGEVTSGSFSPTLSRSIGLARVPAQAGDTMDVEIRGKLLSCRTVKPPFVRKGESTIDL